MDVLGMTKTACTMDSYPRGKGDWLLPSQALRRALVRIQHYPPILTKSKSWIRQILSAMTPSAVTTVEANALPMKS